VAYKPELPPDAMHPIVHMSELKKHVPPTQIVSSGLTSLQEDWKQAMVLFTLLIPDLSGRAPQLFLKSRCSGQAFPHNVWLGRKYLICGARYQVIQFGDKLDSWARGDWASNWRSKNEGSKTWSLMKVDWVWFGPVSFGPISPSRAHIIVMYPLERERKKTWLSLILPPLVKVLSPPSSSHS
jgi:hypothetical protein